MTCHGGVTFYGAEKGTDSRRDRAAACALSFPVKCNTTMVEQKAAEREYLLSFFSYIIMKPNN